MAPIALTLYSRPGCHLCDEMKQIMQPVARELGCTMDEVDISADAELEARFGHEIPVLFVNGRKAFKYRLSERELRKRLRLEPGLQMKRQETEGKGRKARVGDADDCG